MSPIYNPYPGGSPNPYPGYFPPLQPMPITPRVPDPAKTWLLVVLWVALPAIPVGVTAYRAATDSFGWYFLFLAILSPFVLALGSIVPIMGFVVPNKAVRTLPIGMLWIVGLIHMGSVALWGLALTDEDDQDKLFSPLVSGASDPEHLSDALTLGASIAFALTYIAFIALAIAAYTTRRRP